MLGDITSNDIPIYSVNEVLDTYRDYDCSDEAREPILYFKHASIHKYQATTHQTKA